MKRFLSVLAALDLLMAEKKKVDDAIAAEGGGHI